jgi:hypothetical protein
MSQIIKKVFLNSIIPSGFMATGIQTFSPDVFTDYDFAAVFISHTGRVQPSAKIIRKQSIKDFELTGFAWL